MTGSNMVPAGTKMPRDAYLRLKWLAYMRNTTVSALIAAYVEKGLAEEDLSGFIPPDPA